MTSLSLFTSMHWRRKWQPTPVFLLGESQGREPGGCHLWDHTELDTTDVTAAAAARTSKVMLKILQARLQQYMNLNFQMSAFTKGRGTRDQTGSIRWIIKQVFQKNIYFCVIDYAKAFGCVDY